MWAAFKRLNPNPKRISSRGKSIAVMQRMPLRPPSQCSCSPPRLLLAV
jgi:hypothetical protein